MDQIGFATQPCLVVKVGGSLYELPDLGPRLVRWLNERRAPSVLLLPGGGSAADVIRTYDSTHHLGEETSHWLALQMLAVNAEFLAHLVPGARLTTSLRPESPLAVLDMLAFARADDLQPDHLPHSWAVTSDSLAVRVTARLGARDLVLLKSRTWERTDWVEGARLGVVDPYFPQALRQAPDIRVQIINLRDGLPHP